MIDFTAALYGLGKKEAAVQLAQGLGISLGLETAGKVKAQAPAEIPEEQRFRKQRTAASVSLADYLLTASGMGERIMSRHSRRKPFIPGLWRALQKQAQVGISAGCVLLFGETEEKAALITDYGKDVMQL